MDNLGNGLFDRVDALLIDIVNDFTQTAGELTGTARYIAIIGLLVYVFYKGYAIIAGLKGYNGDELKRVLLVTLGLAFYGQFITFINVPLNLINDSLKAVAVTAESEADYFYDYKLAKLDEKERSLSANEADALSGYKDKAVTLIGEDDSISALEQGYDNATSFFKTSIVENVIESAKSVVGEIEVKITEAIYEFFIFLGKVSGTILNATRAFFIISLTLLGVFVIALCAFPGLENSFMKWLQSYITVYIWLGISYLLRFVLSKIYMAVKELSDSGDIIDGATTFLDNKYIVLVGLTAIAGNTMIPALANMIVQTGMGGIAEKLKNSKGTAFKKGGANQLKV